MQTELSRITFNAISLLSDEVPRGMQPMIGNDVVTNTIRPEVPRGMQLMIGNDGVTNTIRPTQSWSASFSGIISIITNHIDDY